MTTAGAQWNRIILVCSSFGIPAVSLLVWIAVTTTQITDKVSSNYLQIGEIKTEVKSIKSDISILSTRLDTVQQRQKTWFLEQRLRQAETMYIQHDNKHHLILKNGY
jgi:hypothetical protein